MADLDKGFSEIISKPREESCLPLDLMSSRGTGQNTAGARHQSILKATSVQILLGLIKTLSQPATRNTTNRADIVRRLDLEAADHSHDVSGRTSPTLTGDGSSSSEDTDNDDSPSKRVLHFGHNDPTKHSFHFGMCSRSHLGRTHRHETARRNRCQHAQQRRRRNLRGHPLDTARARSRRCLVYVGHHDFASARIDSFWLSRSSIMALDLLAHVGSRRSDLAASATHA